MTKKVVFTQADLENKLREWQEKLRLQDWIIKIEIVRQRRMSQSDRLGEIQFNVYTKAAIISILDPVDHDDWFEQDMENTLVHELLHLHFSGISYHFGKGNDVYDMLEEQAIESIASGLISVVRNQNNLKGGE